MTEQQFIEMFGEDAIMTGQRSILGVLQRYGSLTRRELQIKASHRLVSGDAFAASLTLLLERGCVERIGSHVSLTTSGVELARVFPPRKSRAPEWDKSGRKWVRSPR